MIENAGVDDDDEAAAATAAMAAARSTEPAAVEAVRPALTADAAAGGTHIELAAKLCQRKPESFDAYFGCDVKRALSQLPPDDPAARLDVPPIVHFVHPPECVVTEREVSAKVFMAADFPITVEQLVPVLDVVSRTSAHFENALR